MTINKSNIKNIKKKGLIELSLPIILRRSRTRPAEYVKGRPHRRKDT